MTTPPLEDRLSQLADGVIAPATPEARGAIGHRTRVLRRRRRARQAAGAGVLVLAAVAGSIAVARDTTPEARTPDFAGPDAGALPALALDVDGWEIVTAEDTVADGAVPAIEGSVQVFHRPGDVEGPSIVLQHWGASDPVVPAAGEPDEEEVAVGSVTGYLLQTGDEDFILRWAPRLGDNAAEIEARGLARDEVLAFAEGLEGKDESFQYPPEPEDEFGFVAGYVPQGLEEEATPDDPDEPAAARRLTAESATATAELTIEATGDDVYHTTVGGLEQSGGPPEELTVMGHPAVLFGHPDDLGWSLLWQPRAGTTATIVLSGVDRAAIDRIVAGLHEIDEQEWDDLVTAQGTP